MPAVTRLLLACGALVAACALSNIGTAPASPPRAHVARIIELGATTDGRRPGCPVPANQCIAFTRTTGYPALVGGKNNVYKASATGRVVAFKISLGKPTAKQTDYFVKTFGAPKARLTILRPAKGRLAWRVSGQS